MLEPHPPHEPIQGWRGFLVHIGAIVIGLLIAVGLEQSVEALHHRHQRLQLEEQMHEVLAEDAQVVIPADIRKLAATRAFLVELQTAAAGHREGKAAMALPDPQDPRANIVMRLPSLAPYEAARENGTVALLAPQRIRLYNRLALQHEFLLRVYEHWFDDIAALDSFRHRFDYAASPGAIMGVDPAALTPADLTEYQALLGALMSRTDWLILRLGVLGHQSQAILDGIRDETELTRYMVVHGNTVDVKPAIPTSH
jgi:hypothetical protein